MKEQVQISIALRAHRLSRFDERTLYSALLQQTSVPFEVLLYVDPALDAGEWSEAGARVITTSDAAEPISRLLKRSAEDMNGTFLIWLDDEEYLFPDALEQISNALRQAGAEIVLGSGICSDESLTPNGKVLVRREIPRDSALYAGLHQNAFSFSGAILSRDFLLGAGKEAEIKPGEHSSWTKILSGKPRIVRLDSVFLYIKRENPQLRSANRDSAAAVEQLLSENLIEDIFPMLPWVDDALGAYRTALTYLAMLLIRYEAPVSALELLEQIENRSEDDNLKPLRALCLADSGNFEEAVNMLAGKVRIETNESYAD